MSVILYNYRYRGPYEYDKFVYNIFQIANETQRMEEKLINGSEKELDILLEQLNEIIEKLTGPDSDLHSMYLHALHYEERSV